MKILLFSHSFYPRIGGIETVSLMLAKNFQNKREVSVIVVTHTKEDGTEKLPFKVVRDPSIKVIYNLLKWCDVVFENNPCFRMSWLNFIVRKPKIVALHTWIGLPKEKKLIHQKAKTFFLNDYDAVIACSKKIKEHTFKKATVIENSYEAAVFKATTIKKTKDFAFVGRLVSDKGADMCIELLHELNTIQDEKYSLAIIGDGPEMVKLMELTSRYKLTSQIRFLGFLSAEAIAYELHENRFLLVPSRWEEPFGIVVLEGMACGCIPIVSDGGGLPDAVGNAGVVFERNSHESFVQKTVQLLENTKLQQSLLRNAKAHLGEHTEEEVCQQYFNLILKASKT
ncbi:glycosyltransferase family 4 protein [Flavobacterium sp. Arc2]|uniref:glycosyltransferase family 4 protein n=1 Tax=Flavobacterium sp. Arc2 TaxID=3046685 RepID=UPI00352C3271